MTKKVKTLLITGAIGVLSIGLSLPSFAADRLTEDMIREFIQETTRVTASQEDSFDENEIRDYLERHLHEHARFKTTMRYTIPGHDEQKSSMSLKKEEYIDSILKSPTAVGGYDHEIEITDIRIAKDGGNATVTTESQESGEINITADQQVPMEGVSTCNQIIIMNSNNVIQMYSAQCITDVQFTGFDGMMQ